MSVGTYTAIWIGAFMAPFVAVIAGLVWMRVNGRHYWPAAIMTCVVLYVAIVAAYLTNEGDAIAGSLRFVPLTAFCLMFALSNGFNLQSYKRALMSKQSDVPCGLHRPRETPTSRKPQSSKDIWDRAVVPSGPPDDALIARGDARLAVFFGQCALMILWFVWLIRLMNYPGLAVVAALSLSGPLVFLLQRRARLSGILRSEDGQIVVQVIDPIDPAVFVLDSEARPIMCHDDGELVWHIYRYPNRHAKLLCVTGRKLKCCGEAPLVTKKEWARLIWLGIPPSPRPTTV